MRTLVFLVALCVTCVSVFAQSNRYVIQLSVDGLHSEGLRSLMETDPESFSNFQRFVDEGTTTFDARTDATNTFTLPNHTSMLTGRPVTQVGDEIAIHHGYTNNSTPKSSDTLHNVGNPAVDYVASTFDVAHDYGLGTSLYSSKPKFVIYEQSYNETADTAGGRPDQYPDNGDQGTNKIDQYLYLSSGGTSSELVDRFVTDIPEGAFSYAFLHLTEPDAAGHSHGWRTQAWDESVALVDQHLGRVFDMIDQNETLRDHTTIVLTSDHGGLGLFHDDATNPNMNTVPFFVWGQDVAQGADLYEISRGTRLRPLGEQISYESDLQPIRNADGANLAMGLLGLPPIDGSFINSRQDLIVDRPQAAVWYGTDSTSGEAGDGELWSDKRNWARNESADLSALPGDELLFPTNSERQVIQLGGNRTARSLEFSGDYALQGGDLHLISGAVELADDVTVQISGRVTSQTSVVVRGSGDLQITGEIPDILRTGGQIGGEFVVKGSATLLNEVSPGTGIGSIDVDRDLTLGGRSLAIMQIGRNDEGMTVQDSITVGNRLIIRGGMELETVDGYDDPSEAAEFDQFRLLTAGRTVGDVRTLSYNGTDVSFDFATADTRTHFAGDGLFRILTRDEIGISFTNYRAFAGDANGDGAFNTQDFVEVFQAGVYEDGDNDNATWLTGDWNGDQDFSTSDLVVALANGRFEQPPLFSPDALRIVPEPNVGMLLPLILIGACRRRRREPQRLRYEARRRSRSS